MQLLLFLLVLEEQLTKASILSNECFMNSPFVTKKVSNIFEWASLSILEVCLELRGAVSQVGRFASEFNHWLLQQWLWGSNSHQKAQMRGFLYLNEFLSFSDSTLGYEVTCLSIQGDLRVFQHAFICLS